MGAISSKAESVPENPVQWFRGISTEGERLGYSNAIFLDSRNTALGG